MKNIIGIVVLIILGITAYILSSDIKLFSSDRSSFKDFAIKDTASIDQIFISEPNGKSILLTRRGQDRWTVNREFPARPDGIKLLLKTAHDIKVQSTVSKTTYPRVVNRMASSAKKIEFYTGDEKPEKVWYIGDATASRVGTYMLLEKNGEKSTRPFITHLLMERGSLGSRFFANKTLWKDRIVLQSNPKKIKSIEVIHKYDTATSFSIRKEGEANFFATNLENGKEIKVNQDIAIPYFKGFSAIYYEYLDQKSKKEQLDSIYNSEPRHKITIVMEDGKSYSINSYNIPVKKGSTLNDQPIDYHPERMYIASSYMEDGDHPIVQNLTFNILVPNFEEFTSSTTVEK